MNWLLIIEIIYSLLVVAICIRIIYDTRSSSKTLAYLLLTLFVPVGGMLFYLIFGVNIRKRIIYTKKLINDEKRLKELNHRIVSSTEMNLKLHADTLGESEGLVNLLLKENKSPLTSGNAVTLLLNGENKFPEMIQAIQAARHHIHLEYYIYENDIIGNTLKNLLIAKAREGVKVRLIYDDFGSRSIRKTLVKELREGGVEAFPFNRIRLLFFANRINYRNHRKIIIIDGKTAFTGGINISDKYVNTGGAKQFWRDTHIRIDGPGIMLLQHVFICDWNFSSRQKVEPEMIYFNAIPRNGRNVNVQIAASGPDSPDSTIKLSFLKAINLAQREIQLTTPYLIPGGSIMDALKIAALGGVKVKILVPGISDSRLVNAAAWSNYGELLRAGVDIYTYHKGFIHAKTMVVDNFISVVGTANLDHRSFDLNFEVNAIIYSSDFADQLQRAFYDDLTDAIRLRYENWKARPIYLKLAERTARLLSPLL
jgi:cardiolipin synthase